MKPSLHAAALTALATAALSSSFAAHAAATVVIGHAAPMSGPQAHLGKDNANGAQLAVDDLNARGLSIGGEKVTFKLAPEDDGADPRQGTAVAQKFCDSKVNGVVGHMNSGTTIPAAKIYSDCGLPNITPSATNPALTKPGYKTTFRLMANDNDLGAGLAKLAHDKLQVKRVAIIDDRSAYGQGIAEVFKKTALSVGIQVIAEEYTTDKATDFTAILTSIKGKKPDAIFYGGTDPQAGPMLRQMAQLGMSKLTFFGGDGICTTKLAELAAGSAALDNAYCAEGGVGIDKSPKGAAWRKRYEEKFPGQFQIYSPYTYDATMVLADAMVRANSIDPAKYLPFIGKTRYDGISAHIEFTPSGELKEPTMTLFRFIGGKKTALE